MSKTVFAFDDAPFERRLAETIAWCSPRARADDPKLSLRSEPLRPGILERDRPSAVRSVVTQRERGLGGVPTLGVDRLAGGRLLVYFPEADLADGAAELESRGFFDANNVPPWDTWIAFADDQVARAREADISYVQYVIAWVPPALVACADRGIFVNPEECIAWLDQADVRAKDELGHLLRA